RKLFFKLKSEESKAWREGAEPGERVSDELLAERLEAKVDLVHDVRARLAARDFSLDAQLGEAGSATHLDMLADGSQTTEEKLAKAKEVAAVRDAREELGSTLNEPEKYIVDPGLTSDEPETLQSIGERFSLSRERVRQLEKRVLNALKIRLERAPAVA